MAVKHVRPGHLAVVGVTALALPLAGCAKSTSDVQSSGKSGGSGAQTVTVLVSADTNVQNLWDKQLVPGFKAKNPGMNVQVNFDLHGEHDTQNLAKLGAAVKQKQDPGFDVIDAGFVTQAADSKLLEPEDATKVPALAGVNQTIMKAGKGYGVPYRASSVLLAYNTKTVPSPPKTLDQLLTWIKTHNGKFAYNSPKSGGSGQSFVTTVLDANLPQDVQEKLRTSYDPSLEKQWDKGFAVLRSLNPHVYGKGVYPNGNSQVLDLLNSGKIDMAPVWSDQFTTAKANGQLPASVNAAQISDPSFTGGASYLGIPATAAHKDAAQKLIDYVLTPQAQAAIATQIGGYPVIPITKLPADVQQKFKDANPQQLRPTYYSQVANDLNNLWDQKVPGQ